GVACEICAKEMPGEMLRVAGLRDDLEKLLVRAFPGIRPNGNLRHRLPGNNSMIFPGVDADALLLNVPELALSTGSACTSGAADPSHVLTAIGVPNELATSTVRVGIGRFNSAEDIQNAATQLAEAYDRLRCL